MPSELRLGRQVVSWGESTFIQNGLNEVNHYDVSALRVPGSELKEALLPDEMAVFNVRFNQTVSAQFLYLFQWHETKPEPDGSYFSTNDFGTPGGSKVVLGFGEFSDQGVDFRSLGGPFIPNFQAVRRLPDRTPQRRRPVRLQLQVLSAGPRAGHRARTVLPQLSQPPARGIGDDRHPGGCRQCFRRGERGGRGCSGVGRRTAVCGGRCDRRRCWIQRAAQVGGNLSAATAQQYATIGANTLLAGGNVTTQATNIAEHEYAQTRRATSRSSPRTSR